MGALSCCWAVVGAYACAASAVRRSFDGMQGLSAVGVTSAACFVGCFLLPRGCWSAVRKYETNMHGEYMPRGRCCGAARTRMHENPQDRMPVLNLRMCVHVLQSASRVV